jgi:hypothetical protein
MHTRPTVYADVHAKQRHSGSLFFTDWLACNRGSRSFGDPRNSPWSSGSDRIAPDWHWFDQCTGTREWHVSAGYLNHPGVQIDWKQR